MFKKNFIFVNLFKICDLINKFLLIKILSCVNSILSRGILKTFIMSHFYNHGIIISILNKVPYKMGSWTRTCNYGSNL